MANHNIKFIIIAISITVLLIFVFYNKNPLNKMNTNNIRIENNTIYLNSLTLEQKIAQIFIVRANKRNLPVTDLNIGGILVDNMKTAEQYKTRIGNYQNKSKIKLLVATDLEGFWNPFSNFAKSPNLDEIKTSEEAYNLGKEHGKILKKFGFNINFAPVAELEDRIWKHRAFTGNVNEISSKVNFYIKGLQEKDIMATIKHYPGGSLNIKDPHWHSVKAEITEEQLKVFDSALENVSAVMVGHAIVFGAIDSKGKPATVSPEVIQNLRKKFAGLIISDDVNMRGLKNKYIFNEKQLFIELVNAGNDLIIDASWWNLFSKYNIHRKIGYIKEAVKSGKISEKRIDQSLIRILQAKGYTLRT